MIFSVVVGSEKSKGLVYIWKNQEIILTFEPKYPCFSAIVMTAIIIRPMAGTTRPDPIIQSIEINALVF